MISTFLVQELHTALWKAALQVSGTRTGSAGHMQGKNTQYTSCDVKLRNHKSDRIHKPHSPQFNF